MSKIKEYLKSNKFKIFFVIVIILIVLLQVKIYFMLDEIKDDKFYINKRIKNLEEKLEYNQKGFFHLSIDDTIELFKDINEKQDVYISIFDNEILNKFKKLHEQYGLKVTFYCYYESDEFNLSQMTQKYKNEFEENSNWMKFGFHNYNENTYKNATYQKVLREYEQTIEQLINIVGEKSIDYVIRLGYFEASNETIDALTKSKYAISGLLCSDDGRISYSLNEAQQKELDKQEYITTYFNKKVLLFKTDFRLDNIKDKEELINIVKEQKNFIKGDAMEIIFTHEWLLNDKMFEKIETICKIAKSNGYIFKFIENYNFN